MDKVTSILTKLDLLNEKNEIKPRASSIHISTEFFDLIKNCLIEFGKLHTMLSVSDTDYVEKHYKEFITDATFTDLEKKLVDARFSLEEKLKVDFEKKIIYVLSKIQNPKSLESLDSIVSGDITVQIKLITAIGSDAINRVVKSCIEIVIHTLNNNQIINRMTLLKNFLLEVKNIGLPAEWEFEKNTLLQFINSVNESDMLTLPKYNLTDLVKYSKIAININREWKETYSISLDMKFNIKNIIENVIISKIRLEIVDDLIPNNSIRSTIEKEFNEFLSEKSQIDDDNRLMSIHIVIKIISNILPLTGLDKEKILWTYIDSTKYLMRYFSTELLNVSKSSEDYRKKKNISIFTIPILMIKDNESENIIHAKIEKYLFHSLITQNYIVQTLDTLKKNSTKWLSSDFILFLESTFTRDTKEIYENLFKTIDIYCKYKVINTELLEIVNKIVSFSWATKQKDFDIVNKNFDLFIDNTLSKLIKYKIDDDDELINLYKEINKGILHNSMKYLTESILSIKSIDKHNSEKLHELLLNYRAKILKTMMELKYSEEITKILLKKLTELCEFISYIKLTSSQLNELVMKNIITEQMKVDIEKITSSGFEKIYKIIKKNTVG